MEIEQQSEGDTLLKLKIMGSMDELRRFALTVLEAIDDGHSKARIGVTIIKIRRT